MPASLLDKAVDERKIELPLLWFDKLPRDGCQNGVKAESDQFVPHRLHILEAGGAGIVQFAGQHQKGLAVHDKLSCRAILFKMGDLGRFGKICSGTAREKQ
jgi:hypothetical protein